MISTKDWDEHCSTIKFNNKKWWWPNIDQKLQLVNDWVFDIKSVLKLMGERGRGTVIQAGGACGIWPVVLAEYFDLVLTFEPDPLNYWCLQQNTHSKPNIISEFAALGEREGTVSTKLHPTESRNVGAYYTIDSTEGCPRKRIDDMPLYSLDLIYLDIEGREIEALRGAYRSINDFKPYIAIEEKPLPQMGPGKEVDHLHTDALKWLVEVCGYEVCGRIHRDVILKPGA